jgi:general secretion pathway protein B
MSYILDALKKSEKERSLGNVPTLGATGQDEEQQVPLRWFLLSIIGLAVAIALGGGWLLWLSRTAQAPVSGVTAAPGSISTVADPATQPVVVSPNPEQYAGSAGESIAAPLPLFELDNSIRSRIPSIRINVLSYSENRSKRFVMIGQDIFKEGEEVSEGVMVEEIRNSDVIFRFENVRFLLEP